MYVNNFVLDKNSILQARLPGASMVEEIVKKTTDVSKVNPSYMVRVNSDVQKIDKFFHTVAKPAETVEADNDTNIEENINENSTKLPNIVVNTVEDDEVLENSIVDEPIANKVIEKYKTHTALDQANLTYIDPKESFKTRKFQYERIETKLTSVKELRLSIENKCNMNLREILANLIFIACIDCHKSLIQHSTKLYLCDTTRFA